MYQFLRHLAVLSALVGLADFAVAGQESNLAAADKDRTITVPPLSAPAKPRRRVYVLHSGVHTISSTSANNSYGETMRMSLFKQGVSLKDIVVLENPYPTAHWYNMFPRECLTLFMASAQPGSRVSLDAYLRMDRSLRAQGVTSDDELVWVGHSAGGQMGLTLAYLACQHENYADLAKVTQRYRFDTVITLGSPISTNYLPASVKVRYYVSPQDGIPRRLAKLSPPLLWLCGYDLPIRSLPATLSPGSKVRVFFGVEHAAWDTTDRVVERILAESKPEFRPRWHAVLWYSGSRMAVVPFVCQALDDVCRVSYEDVPRMKR